MCFPDPNSKHNGNYTIKHLLCIIVTLFISYVPINYVLAVITKFTTCDITDLHVVFGCSKSHAEKCEFRPVDCPFKGFGCHEKITRKSLDDHIKHCGYVPVPCSHCQAEVARILRKV